MRARGSEPNAPRTPFQSSSGGSGRRPFMTVSGLLALAFSARLSIVTGPHFTVCFPGDNCESKAAGAYTAELVTRM
jgi:hypothetical protein